MGLDNPLQKMSKSIGEFNVNHSIGIVDEPQQIVRAIKRAQTDMGVGVDFDNAGAGVRNLLNIYQAASGFSAEQTKEIFEGKNYGFLKKEVTDVVLARLQPVRANYIDLINNKDYLYSVMQQGAERAREIAHKKIMKVQKALGINYLSQKSLSNNLIKQSQNER